MYGFDDRASIRFAAATCAYSCRTGRLWRRSIARLIAIAD
jgi:hypothetical protein